MLELFRINSKNEYREWHHITLTQLKKDNTDSTSKQYETTIRLDGEVLKSHTFTLTNDEAKDYDNVLVYASGHNYHGFDTYGYGKWIDNHHIYGLRLITERKRESDSKNAKKHKHFFQPFTFSLGYVISVGKTHYIARIGPSTLEEAKAFCNNENMILYTPSFETVHKLIYEKLSGYGITTFWTNAKFQVEDLDAEMTWM